MSGFVVDASVVIKWLVDEPGAEIATLLLDHRLAAPDLLTPECASVLWKKVMRSELTVQEAEVMAAALERADIALHPTRRHLATALALASALRHSAYDCFYLCLAEQLGQPLVTADDGLVGTVRKSAGRFAALVIPLAELPPALAARDPG